MAEFRRRGRAQSYVLAIDAPYGQGKTFFLERFRRQLALKHPVAHLDAWIDDANDEPLVAIMAALQDALDPFIRRTEKVGEKFRAVRAAALPIIGKAISGAGAAIAKRYLGPGIADAVGEEFAKANSKTIDAVAEGVAEGAQAGVDDLIDREAQLMLDAYQRRRSSREKFKANLGALVKSLDETEVGARSPLFVIVDELDRCRPDFAIRVLEEIKHFFDVPGIVFILAIHGDQLSKSVRAIYGSDFDSDAYLRRFFTRKYILRRETMIELVEDLLEDSGLTGMSANYPPLALAEWEDPATGHAKFISRFLAEFDVTGREAIAIIDMVASFRRGWKLKHPIELPLLMLIIIHRIRDRDWQTDPIKPRGKMSFMVNLTNVTAGASFSPNFGVGSLMEEYARWIFRGYNRIESAPIQNSTQVYLFEALHAERAALDSSGFHGSGRSQMLQYAEHVDHVLSFAAGMLEAAPSTDVQLNSSPQ